MKTPKRLQPLISDGLIDEVIRPLMSGKEADVYVVRCGSKIRCAKIYKEALKRSFQEGGAVHRGPQGAQQSTGQGHGKGLQVRA